MFILPVLEGGQKENGVENFFLKTFHFARRQATELTRLHEVKKKLDPNESISRHIIVNF
jgi:hypothetical protein